MAKLIKVEFFKLSRSLTFWLLMLLAFWIGVLNGLVPIGRGTAVTGYEVYAMGLKPDLLYAALISIFAGSFVCDEFANRTFGMNFCCGYTRVQVFLAKMPAFFIGLLPIVLLPAEVSAAVVTVGNGFGREWDLNLVFEAAAMLFGYIFRSLFLGSYALLAASLVRDRIGTFGLGMLGMYILMFVTADALEGPDTLGLFIVVSLLKTIALSAAAVFVFVKRDLK